MSAERVVRDFCEAWSRRDVDELLAFFAEDAVYHNIPLEPAEGTDAIRHVITGIIPQSHEIEFEILNLSSNGNTVLTERVDRFHMADTTIEIPVMGIFEVKDGKISAWRDYFDMNQWTSQMPESPA